jgi:hypothetical protein
VRGRDAHSLQVHFHCAPGIEADPDGNALGLSADGTRLLSISSFDLPGKIGPSYSAHHAWTSRCYGERVPSWHGILDCERRATHDVVSFLMPGANPAVVKELPAESGRLFEISSDEHLDLLAFGEDQPVSHGKVRVSAGVAWLRWRDGSLQEIVLVEAKRLTVDGVDLLREGASIAELSAKVIDGIWVGSSSDLLMERLEVISTSGRRT